MVDYEIHLKLLKVNLLWIRWKPGTWLDRKSHWLFIPSYTQVIKAFERGIGQSDPPPQGNQSTDGQVLACVISRKWCCFPSEREVHFELQSVKPHCPNWRYQTPILLLNPITQLAHTNPTLADSKRWIDLTGVFGDMTSPLMTYLHTYFYVHTLVHYMYITSYPQSITLYSTTSQHEDMKYAYKDYPYSSYNFLLPKWVPCHSQGKKKSPIC